MSFNQSSQLEPIDSLCLHEPLALNFIISQSSVGHDSWHYLRPTGMYLGPIERTKVYSRPLGDLLVYICCMFINEILNSIFSNDITTLETLSRTLS